MVTGPTKGAPSYASTAVALSRGSIGCAGGKSIQPATALTCGVPASMVGLYSRARRSVQEPFTVWSLINSRNRPAGVWSLPQPGLAWIVRWSFARVIAT